MILKKLYCEETKTQKVWYDSTMIVYTEMVENETSNKGDLYVTFKNGSTYLYKDVSFEDYLVLIGGGTDASQGKTLNKVIKGKYEYERVSDKNVSDLLNEMAIIDENNNNVQNTYFISGHRDLTENEFEYYYIPIINKVLYENENACFVVGDSEGLDIMAQNYLMDVIKLDPERITVYCVKTPDNINTNISKVKFNFSDHDEKDTAMTKASFMDIAFVRDWKVITGTGQNILRRNSF